MPRAYPKEFREDVIRVARAGKCSYAGVFATSGRDGVCRGFRKTGGQTGGRAPRRQDGADRGGPPLERSLAAALSASLPTITS